MIGGEPAIGWLQIDMATGEIIDVQENGQHMVAVEYATLLNSQHPGDRLCHGRLWPRLRGLYLRLAGRFFRPGAHRAPAAWQPRKRLRPAPLQVTSSLESAIEDMCCGNEEWTEVPGRRDPAQHHPQLRRHLQLQLVDIKIGGFSNGVAAARPSSARPTRRCPSCASLATPRTSATRWRAACARRRPHCRPARSAPTSPRPREPAGQAGRQLERAGRHAVDFASLTASSATVSQPGGPVLGSGAVDASAVLSSTTARKPQRP